MPPVEPVVKAAPSKLAFLDDSDDEDEDENPDEDFDDDMDNQNFQSPNEVSNDLN
jgi:hypothetical protein